MKTPHVPRLILELALFLFLSSTLFAESTNSWKFNSRTWQTEHGLPHNIVYTVLQARSDYLWLGTYQGLLRFDGVRFTPFHPPDSPLKQRIVSLYETSDGVLWIIPEKGEVHCLKDDKFITCPIKIEGLIKAVLETRDKSLWIGTSTGLLHLKSGTEEWFSKTNGLPDDIVLSLCEDQQGNIWIGTNGGLIRYKDKLQETYHDHYYLPANAVRTLFCDNENILWIGTSGGGLARRRNGKFDYFKREEGLPDLFVTSILKDSRGEIWVGTSSGLSRLQGDRFVAETNDETPYEAVFCITEDRERNLWLGTKEGLSQLRVKPFRSYTKGHGLSHNNVISVCEDRNGSVWMTTWGGGVNVLTNGTLLNFSRTNSPLYDLILSVCETKDGSLWFGADFDGGLFQMKGGSITHYGKQQGLTDQAIRVIHEDREGTLWIGTTSALYSMREGNFQRFTTANGLAGNTIRCVYEDKSGDLWIGSNEGLTRRRGETFSIVGTQEGLSANPVLSIYEDNAGTLWIGTDGGGLVRFNNGKFTPCSSTNGLFSDHILEILEDDRNNLWLSSYSGVFRVKKKNLDDFAAGKISTIGCASFGKADGLSSVQGNGVSKPAAWKTKDGHLWFATTRGSVVVDPKSIRDNDVPPRVLVEELLINKTKVALTENLVIPPAKGDLEFRYTALSLSTAEKTRYKYKLEPIDADWIDVGDRRIAYYSNVKPGAYTFRVIACNNEGVWNTTGANLKFTLLPHFWQAKWFVGFVMLICAGFVAAIARYVTWKRVQIKLQQLEHQHAIERERSRIAQDMHDDLGARLTEIMFLSNTAERRPDLGPESGRDVKRIAEASRELTQNLDAIVWATEPRNDTLENLTTYLQDYAERYLNASGIRCLSEIQDHLPDRTISSEVRHNIFLTFKEALNNIAKHAQATEVHFVLSIANDRLKIVVQDDGKGFPETFAVGGNGLHNMRTRIEKIGGCFEQISEGGKGTRICFQIQLNRQQ